MYYDIKQSGDRIRKLRMRAGYTQEKMAEQLSIDRSFYSRIESGKKGCSIDLLIQLSLLFGVSLDYIVLGRYSAALLNDADKAQLKEEMQKLAVHLEQVSASL